MRIGTALLAVSLLLPATSQAQSVLLVDDDDNSPNLSAYYEAAMADLGLTYAVWDTAGGGGNGPHVQAMLAADLVIWWSGDHFGGLKAFDEVMLADYLDQGGKLFLSSQDTIYDLGITPFLTDYLGVSTNPNGDDAGGVPLYGIAGDWVSDAYPAPPYDYNAVGMSEYADDVGVEPHAVETFHSGGGLTGIGALRVEAADYRTMFFATPFTPLFADPATAIEILDRCIHWLAFGPCDSVDDDGDGFSECDGDCDDAESTVYPAAPEVCDDGIDQNCDGQTDEYADDDGDGLSNCDGDCDDFEAEAFLGNPEACDFIDNDCDGEIDEDFDGDADGYTSCDSPADCDDADGAIYPGQAESCDGIDNNCDGQIDEGLDGDGDGISICAGDCDDANPDVYPGAPELCDELDNDCDEALAEYEYDNDGDGYLECAECDDGDADVFPGAEETCDDGVDGDCLGDLETTEVDDDGDGISECGGDCDDGDPSIHPEADEQCNGGIDDDCNPATDELADQDHDGYTICGADCDDFDATANPGADEICDGIDNDCNGTVDDALDNDHDGYSGCGGDDCDDANAGIYPGATEVPYDQVDQDCDGEDLNDIDGDGFAGGPFGTDCDDNEETIHPGAEEICDDGIDGDCDGVGDEVDDDCAAGDDGGGGCDCRVDDDRYPEAAFLVISALCALVARRRNGR